MKRNLVQWRAIGLAFFFAGLSANFEAFGAAIWSNPSSGLWRDTNNWSGLRAPSLALGGTYITNATTKTVTVDALTPLTNLFINSLNVWGRANTTNTLRLLDVGTNAPLVVSNSTMTIAKGGALIVTNSSLVVTGRNISFNVWAGEVILESGSIIAREEPPTTNVTVMTRIGRTNLATLTINGGLMHASMMQVGESPGAQFGPSEGVVRITGGTLSIGGELSIGSSLLCAGRVNMSGGQLLVAQNLTNIMRIGDEGAGTLTVSNATVSVGDVSVGRHDGAVGVMALMSGGFLGGGDDVSIGRFSGATGMVFVAGGQMVITNHPIWVGREGIGELIVSNGLVQAQGIQVAVVPTNTARGSMTLSGGSVLVSSNFTVGDGTISTAQALLAGGSLVVTNDSGSAYVEVASGTLALKGGTVTVDHVLGTNAGSRFVFSSGALRTKSTVISNGVPFVIGDGTNAANLHLIGGTHFFADGLVISSNASLTGCGTIIGPVSNHGIIATNCNVVPQPRITRMTLVGTTATLFFESVNGAKYFLEYKDHLPDSIWQVGPSTTGSGGIMTLADSTAIVPTRFYRLRVE